MKQKVFPLSDAAVLPRRVYGRWWPTGTAAATAATENVATLSVYIHRDRCTLGSKENLRTCFSSPCLYIPPLGYPLPMLHEHFCVLLGCVTILFGETIEKKKVYLTYKSLSV